MMERDTHWERKVSRKDNKIQALEFALVLVLVLVVVTVWLHIDLKIWIAAVALLALVVPKVFAPLARAWAWLSHQLGTVMSSILLFLIYFLIVTPIGVVRSLLGKDTLKKKAFKKGDGSVMVIRNHLYAKEDFKNMF